MKTKLIKTMAVFQLAWGALYSSYAQGTFQVTFDEPTPQPPGTAYDITQYQESSLSFMPIQPDGGFGRSRGGRPGYLFPDNGTSYIQAALTERIAFSHLDGLAFGLVSVDLAGYSVVLPDFSVRFVGHTQAGGTVTTTFSGSGLDFKTFYFGPEFINLTRVEIPDSPWSLDNLVFSIPEPASGLVLLSGGLLFCLRRARQGRG